MKIGIDLGGTKTEGILIDSNGKELDRQRIKTEKNYDGSIQGIEHSTKPFYSIQCHPEASPGPKEFEVLFKRFFEDMNA